MAERTSHGTLRLAGCRAITRRSALRGGLSLLAVPLLAACSQATPTPSPTTAAKETAATPTTAPSKPSPAAGSPTAGAASPTAAAQPTGSPAATKPSGQIGGTVEVLAVWAGDEEESFRAMIQPFEEQTGTKVEYSATRDLNAVLETRVQGGNPPDVAGLPGPGQMADFARAGKLIDLASVLDMSAMTEQYAEDWIKLGQVEGKQVGIFIKASMKGPIWYNPKAFQQAGYQIPKTWDELMKLSQDIAASGTTPWSIALESEAASGWPGTDWIEDIVLRQAGPDVYDQWYQGQVKWTSPEIKKAWETWGTIVGDTKMVYGGIQGMLATNFQNGADPLFTDPPNAYLHHQATFVTGFIEENNPDLNPVDDYNFFPFPDIDAQYAGALTGSGDLFGMFNDTPQARALIQHLVTPAAQEIWVKRGGALSPNKKVSLDSYPDPIAKQSAQTLTSAQTFRFDASDLMPEAMNNAFWKAILDFAQDPTKLESILANLDKAQEDAYKT